MPSLWHWPHSEKWVFHTLNVSIRRVFPLMSLYEARTIKGVRHKNYWFTVDSTVIKRPQMVCVLLTHLKYVINCGLSIRLTTLNTRLVIRIRFWWEKVNRKLLFTKRLMVRSIDFEWIITTFCPFISVGDGLNVFLAVVSIELLLFVFYLYGNKSQKRIVIFPLIWWEFFIHSIMAAWE